MSKRKGNKSFFYLLLLIGIASYFFFHVYFVVNSASIQTYTLDLGEISLSTDKEIMIIRDEYQLKAPSDGYISFYFKDGDRVKKMETVGKVENEQVNADEQETLQIINRRINELNNKVTNENLEKEISEINSQIDFVYLDIQHRISDNDISYIPELKEQILGLMERKALISGSSSIGKMTLEELQAKKYEIEEKMNTEKSYLKSETPGILSFYSDGSHDVFSIVNKNNLSVQKINKFKDSNLVQTIENVKQGEVVATVVNNHKWYIATEVTNQDIKVIERGKKIEIVINKEHIDASLEDFYKSNDDKFVGIFVLENENFDFTKKRKHNAKIFYANPSGLLLPKKSVVSYEGVKGIFIVNEVGIAVFKKMDDLIGENEEYYILKYDPNVSKNTEKINLYDELILSPQKIKNGQKVKW